MDLSTVKHVGRLKDIVFVLAKYGFDDVVERLEIPGKFLLREVTHVDSELTTSQRVRHALEDLGPTFVKFGQVMSVRADLLPADLTAELRKLHDEVAPVEFPSIREKIEHELGAPLDRVFVQFDETPIAAGSLAQVHRAVLREERQAVAVKVQRPDIRGDIDSDIAITERIADQLHQRSEAAACYDLPNLVTEFKKTLLRELNYCREARHMRIFESNFVDDPQVHIPQIYEQHSTEQMLVMELIEGIKLNEVPAEPCERRQGLARLGLRVVVKQILLDGFFHADPHPGNVMVRRDDVLCLLDCGMVGRLTDQTRFRLTDLIQATVTKDSDRLVDVLLDLTGRYDPADRGSLQRDLLDLLDEYHSVPLERLNLGNFLAETIDVLRAHQLALPQDLAVMIKALITAEGVVRDLDPDLDVIAEIQPQVRRLVEEQWRVENLWKLLRSNLSHLWSLQQQLPRRVGQILEKLEHGELAIEFRHENLKDLLNALEDIASRLTVAIIVGSIVIGSSLIVTAEVGPELFGFPALGMIGYLISAILGLWIVFNILRSRW